MTIQEWKALCRMTLSTSTNSYLGHYKGIPLEISSNSTLSRVFVITNHETVVPMRSFTMNDDLPILYRKVFRELYNTWHSIEVDNLPF